MQAGMKMACKQLEMIVRQIKNIVDSKRVVSAGPFLYVIIQEGTPDCEYLSRLAVFHCSMMK
jgi:hypothetical protein